MTEAIVIDAARLGEGGRQAFPDYGSRRYFLWKIPEAGDDG